MSDEEPEPREEAENFTRENLEAEEEAPSPSLAPQPELLKSEPPPDLWRRDQRRLAVPYPEDDAEPTKQERETGCLIVICHALAPLARGSPFRTGQGGASDPYARSFAGAA